MSSANKIDLINEALTRGYNPDLRLKNLLQTVLDTFEADRAWLLYPCNPHSKTYRIPKEVTTAQFPGAHSEGISIPMTPLVKNLMQQTLSTKQPVAFELGHPLLTELEIFSVQSQLVISILPVIGSPWLFGIHQCSFPRLWKIKERKLFADIAERISDTLTNYLLFHEHKQNEVQYRALFEFSHDGLIIIDQQGKPLVVNNHFCQLTGYSQSEALSPHFIDKISIESSTDIKKLFKQLFAGNN